MAEPYEPQPNPIAVRHAKPKYTSTNSVCAIRIGWIDVFDATIATEEIVDASTVAKQIVVCAEDNLTALEFSPLSFCELVEQPV
ncbi:MAG: hypothetical protein KDB27_31750 [Planctomycetales bacterium]|nr:hypothetical protein [Planctomycetales bacterium]